MLPRRRFGLSWALSFVCWRQGRLHEALGWAETMIGLAVDDFERSLAMGYQAQYLARTDPAAAGSAADAAIRAAERSGSDIVAASSMNSLGIVQAIAHEDQALTTVRRALHAE